MMVDKRHEYDKFTKHANIIEELPYKTFIATATIIKILVVASREIVFTSQLITSKKTNILYTPTFSVEHESMPIRKDPVRAEVFIGGWIVMPRGDGCQIIYTCEIDLKGNIPTYLVEKTADIQVLVVVGLKDYMIKMEACERGPNEIPVKYFPEEEYEPVKKAIEEDKTQDEFQFVRKTTPIESQPEEQKISKPEEQKVPPPVDEEEEEKVTTQVSRPMSKKEQDKYKTPQELEIDVSFCSLGEADTEEPVLHRTDIPEDIRELIMTSRKITYDLFREINGPYKKYKPQKKIGIYVRDNDKGQGQSVLGIGEIPFNIQKVADILLDESQRKNFDDLLQEGTILNQYDPWTFVIYITFKRVLILSPRDFLC